MGAAVISMVGLGVLGQVSSEWTTSTPASSDIKDGAGQVKCAFSGD